MARTRPTDRFETLIRCATEVFIRSGGYTRTQIVDVATEMGVAKGTVYLYVESKEALFDQVMKWADAPGPIPEPAMLPLPTPSAGATIERLAGRIRDGGEFPSLRRALERKRVGDIDAELSDVIGDIYDQLYANKTAIKLVGTSAHDWPELAELWFVRGRERLVSRLTEYLGDRALRKRVRLLADPRIAARMVIETVTWFAVHRFWDPAPETIAPIDDSDARTTVIRTLTTGLIAE